MLNVTSKSENGTFLITEFASLPKFESSRNVTSKVISNRIKARKSKSTEQYDCKLFFRLDGTCNPMVELSTRTQQAEILSRQSNLTPQQGMNFVNDLFVVPKSLST